MALIGAGGILFFALHRDLDNSQCRSLAFLALMACNFALIFVNCSYSASIIRILSRHNPWLWVSVIIVPASWRIVRDQGTARYVWLYPDHDQPVSHSHDAGLFSNGF